MTIKKNIILLLLNVFIIEAYCQLDGTLDNSFNGNGKLVIPTGINSIGAFEICPDRDSSFYFVYGKNVSHILSNGQYDLNFGNNGTINLNIWVNAIETQSNGKIIIGGTLFNSPIQGVIEAVVYRFNLNGTLDTSFANNGVFKVPNSSFTSLIISKNDKIILNSYTTAATPHYTLTKISSNGVLDLSFFSPCYITATSPQLGKNAAFSNNWQLPNGDIYCYFAYGSSQPLSITPFLLKLDSNGSCYTNNTSITWQNANLKYSKNNIYQIWYPQLVCKFKQNLTLDSTFGNNGCQDTANFNGQGLISSAQFQTDGKVIVGSILNGNMTVSRLSSQGMNDPIFGTNGTTSIPFDSACTQSMVRVLSNGKIITAAVKNTFFNEIAIARLYSNTNISNTQYFPDIKNNPTLFPNPTNNIITINYENKIDKISLTDINGKTIKIFPSIVNRTISIADIQKGIYVLELVSNNIKYNLKVIKTDN